jgi:hypothetical protein
MRATVEVRRRYRVGSDGDGLMTSGEAVRSVRVRKGGVGSGGG